MDVRPAQTWIVDLYGSRRRVRTICRHEDLPLVWTCELLKEVERGTGSLVTVRESELIEIEYPDQQEQGP